MPVERGDSRKPPCKGPAGPELPDGALRVRRGHRDVVREQNRSLEAVSGSKTFPRHDLGNRFAGCPYQKPRAPCGSPYLRHADYTPAPTPV